MQPASSATFSARELRTLKKIYSFRKVRENLNKNTFDPSKNKSITYVCYGSRDALSPSQYNIFREFVIKNGDLNKISIEIKLIPANIFKSFARFSQLQTLQRMLKGNIYQIKLTIPVSVEKANEISFTYEANAYKVLFTCFNQFKRIQFTEKTYFDYSPSIFLAQTKNNSVVPIRFNQLITRSKSLQINHVEDIVVPIFKATFLIRSNLIFLQDKLSAKTNYLAK